MYLLVVVGVVLFIVGLLGVLKIVALSLALSIVLALVGLALTVWFGRAYVRRP